MGAAAGKQVAHVWECIDEQYAFDDDLGSGKYATCHKAHLISNPKKKVAIKQLDKSQKFFKRSRVLREIAALRGLDHPCIVGLIKVFEDSSAIFLVQELVSGGELLDRITPVNMMDERSAAVVTRQVLSAVSYLHSRGVTHRDIKAANILMVSNDPASPHFLSLKLCDLGLAHRVEAATAAALESTLRNGYTMKTMCGSPTYMAPEIAKHVGRDNL